MSEKQESTTEKKSEKKESFKIPEISKATIAYILMGVGLIIVVFIGWYLKVYKKKTPNFLDEDDDYEDQIVNEDSFWNKKEK